MSSLSIRRRLHIGSLVLVLLIAALCVFNIWSSKRLARSNDAMSHALEAAVAAEKQSAQVSDWIALLDRTKAGQDAAVRQLAEAVIGNRQSATLYPDGSPDPLSGLFETDDLDRMLAFLNREPGERAGLAELSVQLQEVNREIIDLWRPRHGELLHQLNDLKRALLYWNLKITNSIFVRSTIGELVYETLDDTPIESFRQSLIYLEYRDRFPELATAIEQAAEMNRELYAATDRLDTLCYSGDWDKVRRHYRDTFPALIKSIAVEIDQVLALENLAVGAQQRTLALLSGSLAEVNRRLFAQLGTLSMDLHSAQSRTAEIAAATTLALQDKRLEASAMVNSAASYNIILSLAVILLGLAGSFLITRSIIRPLNVVVEKMEDVARGEGDLTRTINVTTRDEMGTLAGNFNLFVGRLREIIQRARVMFVALRSAVGNIDAAAGKVRNGARQQGQQLKEAHAGLTAVDRDCRTIARSTETLLEASRESSSATLEMNGVIEEISEQTERLFAIVDEVTSSNQEMSASSNEIAGNIREFADNLEKINGSILALDKRTARIETLADQTHRQAEQVYSDAQEGREAVATTIAGVETLNAIVQHASETITQLGAESEAIGQVLQVIDEIADQTNLLALNATIIAAQAGSHGRAFAVVAEEVRLLADRTAVSTHEIGAIIDKVQTGTDAAVRAISDGRARVEQEVALARAAGDRLAEIEASSSRSTQQVEEIVHVAHEQTVESGRMTENVERAIGMIQQIAASVQQQTQGVRQAATASENMREIAFQLRRGTEEQAQGSRMISRGMEQIQSMIEAIGQATLSQTERSRAVVALFDQVRKIAEDNIESSTDLELVVLRLAENATGLEQELGSFKIGEQPSAKPSQHFQPERKIDPAKNVVQLNAVNK